MLPYYVTRQADEMFKATYVTSNLGDNDIEYRVTNISPLIEWFILFMNWLRKCLLIVRMFPDELGIPGLLFASDDGWGKL